MTRTRRCRLPATPWLAASALALTLLAPAARAQFVFTAPTGATSGGTITAHAGDTLTFVGRLTNNYRFELDNVSIAPQFTAMNARYFPSYDTQIAVLGYPETFNIGDSAPSHKLTITVTSSTPPGNYAFYFDANAAGDGNGNYTGDIFSDNYLLAVVANASVPPPTNLTAVGSEKAVTLNWTAPAGVTNATYNVYRGTAAGGESATPVATGLSATAYTDSSLTDGTAYFYMVKTLANGGISVASNEASATPVLAPPTALTAVGSEKAVTLNWSAPAGVTGATYSVYRGTAAGGESATPVAMGLTTTTYPDAGLTDGTTYFYMVKTLVNGDVSAASNEASATADPTPPTALTATTAKNVVTLTWMATVTGTGVTYNVYRGTASGGESATPIAKGVKASPYTDLHPVYGVANYYVVRTVVGTAVSGPSNEALVTPVLAAPTAPILKVTAGNATVSLIWTAPAGAATYSVYRANGGAVAALIVSGLKSIYYHDNAVANGTTYAYYVIAINTVGSSPNSNTVTATPAPAPTAPTALTATAGSKKVTLAWTAPTGPVASYSVFRGLTAGGESAIALKTGLTTTTYADTKAAVGTTYFYVVKAINGAGASPASNEASAAATL